MDKEFEQVLLIFTAWFLVLIFGQRVELERERERKGAESINIIIYIIITKPRSTPEVQILS